MATLKGVTLTLLMGPVAVAPAPTAVVDALESAQVTTAVGQRSGFQIVFTFSKTSPIATTLLPAGLFDPLIRVILVATLNGVPKVLADGPIKRQDLVASSHPGENKLTITDDRSLKLTLTPSSGLFQGSILNSDNGKPLKFQGALLQDMNLGLGYFLNTDQSGLIYFGPAP